MPIEFDCPNCGQFLRTADDKVGLQATCPGCGLPIVVPGPDEDAFDETYSLQPDTGPVAPPPFPRDTASCPMCGEQNSVTTMRCRFCGEHLSDLYPGGAAEGQFVYAGFWPRFGAFVVDGSILLLPSFLCACCIVPILVSFVPVAVIFIAWPYFALLESSESQATIGKMAAGLVVISSDGRRITFGQASGRHFAKLLSGIPLFIGFIMAGLTERKQALHDILADCLVVRRS